MLGVAIGVNADAQLVNARRLATPSVIRPCWWGLLRIVVLLAVPCAAALLTLPSRG
jgi:hypothetical protein